MVSYAPCSQSYNFTHMYDFVDLRGPPPVFVPNKGTLYDYFSQPDFSRFKLIIDRANMVGRLNDLQADCTILAPRDEYLKHISPDFFKTLDSGLARQIVDSSIIDRKINGMLFISSPVCYYFTRNPQMRMYITNIWRGKEGVSSVVNNCAKIVEYDIECTNGLVHEIDGLILPTQDHFMN